jgi:hypothetical protein
MTHTAEKGFCSPKRAILIQDQAPPRKRRFKNPVSAIRLLPIPIPQHSFGVRHQFAND